LSTEEEKQGALVPAQSSALARVGAKSLFARGHDLLRQKEVAAAECHRKGLEFCEQERLGEAFQVFRRGAEIDPNEMKLQFAIGWCYCDGVGVERDYPQAAFWFRKAADQGHAAAQYLLGLAYYSGLGLDKDYGEAAHWFQKAASQGTPDAQAALGTSYWHGHGVSRDFERATYWLRLAANQGHREAQAALTKLAASR
jgi:uncharacterized protein